MSMKMVCDRCNKVKEDGESFDHIEYMPTLKEYDLCPECSRLFFIFMDGGEVEEDHYKDSKPCSVIIHKLANGNYGIESVPDDQEEHAKFDDWLINKREEEAMNKEESDLSVKTHTNVAGVTVPDSEPWKSLEGRKKDKTERCFG